MVVVVAIHYVTKTAPSYETVGNNLKPDLKWGKKIKFYNNNV